MSWASRAASPRRRAFRRALSWRCAALAARRRAISAVSMRRPPPRADQRMSGSAPALRQSPTAPWSPCHTYQPASSRGRSGRVENLWNRPSGISLTGSSSPTAAAAARNSAGPSDHAIFIACDALLSKYRCVVPHAGGKLCHARATAPSPPLATPHGRSVPVSRPAVSFSGRARRADMTSPPMRGAAESSQKMRTQRPPCRALARAALEAVYPGSSLAARTGPVAQPGLYPAGITPHVIVRPTRGSLLSRADHLSKVGVVTHYPALHGQLRDGTRAALFAVLPSRSAAMRSGSTLAACGRA